MKRMTTILLALVLLLAMTATAYAQDTVTITVGDIDATVGDIVEVPVMISEGHYAVNGRIFLTYDPQILALQKVCPGEDNPYFEDVNTDILDSGYMWAFKMPREGQANFVFATAANTGNATGGVLYTLTFAVLRDAKNAAITVTVPEMQVNNGSGDVTVEPTLVDGTVNAAYPDHTPAMKGDINGDGNVSLPDATRLFYYVNGMLDITPQQMLNADVTGDGIVNLNDALRLFYYISGMVEL